MKIAKEITLWSLDVYKIHIKEWPTVKDKILSLLDLSLPSSFNFSSLKKVAVKLLK